MNFGVISYAIGGASFLVLFLLLLTSWRGRLQGALLVMAVFITLLWTVAAAGFAVAAESPYLAILYRFLEVARNVVWLAFLFQLLEPLAGGKSALAKVLHFSRPGLFIFAGLFLLTDMLPHYLATISPEFSLDIRILGHVILTVGGLALIEQLFRNTRPDRRWATKYLYLGIGALFAYDFFLYADALLFKRIDEAIWQARGLVNAMMVPLIAVAAARNPEWSLDVFVSRRMVIHSASIFGAGLYLLVMAGVGYYIRFYGGTWGSAVQMAFLFGAVLLLLMMLFSGQLRAFSKVFLSKHFFSYKYDYRDEWLKFIGTLSATNSNEPLRDRAIRAIAGILDSPAGVLWMRGESGHYSLATTWNLTGLGKHSEPGDSSLIEFLERRQWVIDLDEYRREPELYEELKLPHWLREVPRAWLIVPLMQLDALQGFVVLTRSRAVQKINWEDRDLLKTAGSQVASYVALVDTTEALMDARQFEAFNRLSAYVVHDLKNVAGQLSLVVANAARHKTNPVFVDDAFRTVENATAKMNRMLAQLRKGSAPLVGEAKLFSLDETIREVIAAHSTRVPIPTLVSCDPGLVLHVNRDRFMTVLGHLIQNAQEATGPEGKVEVESYRHDRRVVIEIHDDGCGMDERFIRERLFRPFSTTKGNAGMGIGVYESREFVYGSGGDIDVASKLGVGTTFSLRFPLINPSVSQENHQQMEVLNCVSQPRSY